MTIIRVTMVLLHQHTDSVSSATMGTWGWQTPTRRAVRVRRGTLAVTPRHFVPLLTACCTPEHATIPLIPLPCAFPLIPLLSPSYPPPLCIPLSASRTHVGRSAAEKKWRRDARRREGARVRASERETDQRGRRRGGGGRTAGERGNLPSVARS